MHFSAILFVSSFAVCAMATAQTPLSADAFEAHVTGRTLVYGTPQAGPYGIEEYRPGRQVRWSFLDGDCVDGHWYPQDGAICFAYEGRDDAECWLFYLEGGRLRANTLDAPSTLPLYEISESPEPLVCLGPRIGV
jgi:hypothetical protein